MKTLVASIRGTTRYSQSRAHGLIKAADESFEDFDLRTVLEHLHYDADGMVYISPSTFKNCLDEAAAFLKLKKIRSETYTKHFEAGVAVFEPIPLGIHKDAVPFERLFLNLDGKRGSGQRGFRHYPYIEAGWRVEVPFTILDETVLQRYTGNQDLTIFAHVLRNAGVYIGIGRWRPKNRGLYGRFAVEQIVEAVEELPLAAE
jgi:hypothetical protein